MTSFEKNRPDDIIGIPLRIGAKALEVLRITPAEIEAHGEPPVALVEFAKLEEDAIFALGGWNVRRNAGFRGVILPTPQEILETANSNMLRSQEPDTVSLALTRQALAGLAIQPYEFDLPGAPKLGISRFGPVYRLGGDMIADFVEGRGARTTWGSNIDSQGNDNTGENSFN